MHRPVIGQAGCLAKGPCLLRRKLTLGRYINQNFPCLQTYSGPSPASHDLGKPIPGKGLRCWYLSVDKEEDVLQLYGAAKGSPQAVPDCQRQ